MHIQNGLSVPWLKLFNFVELCWNTFTLTDDFWTVEILLKRMKIVCGNVEVIQSQNLKQVVTQATSVAHNVTSFPLDMKVLWSG